MGVPRIYRVGWQRSWSASRVLLATMAVMFVFSSVLGRYFHDVFALSICGLRSGRIWQLLTYSLMHADFWHLFGNGLILFFIGRVVEQQYGSRILYSLFFFASLTGALVWLLVNYTHPGRFLIGASAGCLGIFTYFCLALRDRPLTFLFFFILPIRLRPRTLLAITVGLEVLGFFTQELAGYGTIANSAHLGGFLGGYLVYILSRRGFDFGKIIQRQWKEWSTRKSTVQGDSYRLYIAKNASQRQEIDRILDKINATGFQSLTPEERDTLESAKQLMHR